MIQIVYGLVGIVVGLLGGFFLLKTLNALVISFTKKKFCKEGIKIFKAKYISFPVDKGKTKVVFIYNNLNKYLNYYLYD